MHLSIEKVRIPFTDRASVYLVVDGNKILLEEDMHYNWNPRITSHQQHQSKLFVVINHYHLYVVDLNSQKSQSIHNLPIRLDRMLVANDTCVIVTSRFSDYYYVINVKTGQHFKTRIDKKCKLKGCINDLLIFEYDDQIYYLDVDTQSNLCISRVSKLVYSNKRYDIYLDKENDLHVVNKETLTSQLIYVGYEPNKVEIIESGIFDILRVTLDNDLQKDFRLNASGVDIQNGQRIPLFKKVLSWLQLR